MRAVCLPVALLTLALTTCANAAPAPFAKPPRADATADQVIQILSCEGYDVRALKPAGPAGLWVVTIRIPVLACRRSQMMDLTYQIQIDRTNSGRVVRWGGS